MRFVRPVRLLIVLSLPVGVLGCGKSNDRLYGVRGKVTIDGKAAPERTSVTFQSTVRGRSPHKKPRRECNRQSKSQWHLYAQRKSPP